MSDRFRSYLFLALLAGFSLSAYLLASRLVFRLGFPLDDAWIHQTYARNLAQRGEWAFLSGQPSAGSTAPLWSALLSLGFVLHLGPSPWTYLLGWLILTVLAITGMHIFQVLCPSQAKHAFWAGAFLALEWHLVWAAGSGMETLLIALVVLVVLGYLAAGGRNWLSLGVVIGLSAWIRPDGLTLFAPAFLAIFFSEPAWRGRWRNAVRLVLGTLVVVIPYLAFNRYLSGVWLPNTFFAKQAEYAAHRSLPLWQRFLQQASLPLIGAGALLLPGFVISIENAARKQSWGVLLGAAWVIGYLLLFALRLPVTYQHGRYIMPAMPVYFIWSLSGMASWVQPSAPLIWRRVLGRVWILSTGLVLILFWLQGARAYAYDVAVIESEMVDTARWVATNTEPHALVAAHDIGALGYFGQRQIIDLAGLVSPEVIPFIRDEARLQAFLDQRMADYLVTFPGWYPALVQNRRLVYTSQSPISPQMGGENMAVYLWPESCNCGGIYHLPFPYTCAILRKDSLCDLEARQMTMSQRERLVERGEWQWKRFH